MSLLVTLVACYIVFTTCSTTVAAKSTTLSTLGSLGASSSIARVCNATFPECSQQLDQDLRYNTRFADTSWYHSLDGECCILARFSYCINVKYSRRAVFSYSIADESKAEKCREITKKLFKVAECDDQDVTYPSLYCSAFFNSHIIGLCVVILVLTICFYCCAKMCASHRERKSRSSSQYVLLKVPVANVDRYVTLNQGPSHDKHTCCQVCPKQMRSINKQKPSCPSEDLMPYPSQPLVNSNLPNYYSSNQPGAF